jgi:hypothetical protein
MRSRGGPPRRAVITVSWTNCRPFVDASAVGESGNDVPSPSSVAPSSTRQGSSQASGDGGGQSSPASRRRWSISSGGARRNSSGSVGSSPRDAQGASGAGTAQRTKPSAKKTGVADLWGTTSSARWRRGSGRSASRARPSTACSDLPAAPQMKRPNCFSHRGLENAPRFSQLPQPTLHGVDQRQPTAILSPRHVTGTLGGMLLSNRGPMVLKTDS